MTVLAYNDGIWASLLKVMDDITNDKLADFQGVAISLAAMLACFSLLKFATSYVQGENSFSWKLLRPIVILICTMQFNTICVVFDHTVGVFARDIAEASDGSFKSLSDAYKNALKTAAETEWQNANSAENQDRNLLEKAWTYIRGIASVYNKSENISKVATLGVLSRGLCELVFIVFEVLCAFYLIILRLMGPFILAMSIPEHWKNNIAQFVSRYIQIYLWVPIGYLNLGIITMITRSVCNNIALGTGTSDGVGPMMLGFALVVADLVTMFAIPKIAGWIVESAGSGNAQSPLERGAAAGTRMFMHIK